MAMNTLNLPIQRLVDRSEDDKFKDSCRRKIMEQCEYQCKTFGKDFAYDMPEAGAHFLYKNGVFLAPEAPFSHSHPVCKTLENHFLHFVLPTYIGDSNKWMFCSMKNTKWTHFLSVHKMRDIMLLNRLVLKGDTTRYARGVKIKVEDHDPQIGFTFSLSDPTSDCSKGKKILSPNSDEFSEICSLLDSKEFGPFVQLCAQSKKKRFFFHDELHHWTEESLLRFLNEVNPDLVCGTTVFPLEIMAGLDYSANPSVYEFEFDGDDILFFPDGRRSEFWRQRKAGSWLFSRKRIFTKHGVYTVSVPKIIGAHEFVTVEKGDLHTDRSITYSNFEVLDPRCVTEFHFREVLRGVRYEFVTKLLNYLLTLKKADKESAVGKLRQLDKGLVGNLHETLLAKELGEFVAKHGVASLLTGSVVDEVKEWGYSFLPWRLRRSMVPKYHAKLLLRFLRDVKPLTFNVRSSSYGAESCYNNSWEFIEKEIAFENKTMDDDLMKVFHLQKVGASEFQCVDSRVMACADTSYYSIQSCKKSRMIIVSFGDVSRVVNHDYFDREDYLERDFAPHFSDKGFLRRPMLTWYGFSEEKNKSHELPIVQPSSQFDDWFDQQVAQLKEEDEVIEEFCSNVAMHSDSSYNKKVGDDLDEGSVNSDILLQKLGEHRKFLNDNLLEIQALSSLNSRKVICLDQMFAETRKLHDLKHFLCFIPKSKESKDDIGAVADERIEIEDLGVHDDDSIVSHNSDESNSVLEQVNEYVYKAPRKRFATFSEDDPDMKHIKRFSFNSEQDCEKEEVVAHDDRSEISEKSEEANFLINHEENHSINAPAGVSFTKMQFDEVLDVEFDNLLNGAKSKQINGRKAFFFCENGWTYGHNGILYDNNPYPSLLRQLGGSQYNSALVQIYSKNSGIGMHKDDESCYEGTDIFTINFKGTAELHLDDMGKDDWRYFLKPGDCFKMSSDFNLEKRHGIQKCSADRVSITFRRQVHDCDANGNAIVGPKGCFWTALSKCINVPLDDIQRRVSSFVSAEVLASGKVDRQTIEDVFCHFDVQVLVDNCGKEQFWGSSLSSLTTKKMRANHDHIECLDEVGVYAEDTFMPQHVREAKGLSIVKRVEYLEDVNRFVFWAKASSAKQLSSCLKNNTTGVVSNHILNRFTPLGSGVEDRSFRMFSLWGFAGSGKSRRIKKLTSLYKNKEIVVVTPRARLAKDWAKEKNVKCYTFESALCRNLSKASMIIFDEVFLFPTAYVDLFLLKMDEKGWTKDKVIMALGDPLQAGYYNEADFGKIEEGGKLVQPGDFYLNYSFRCGKWLNKVFDTTVLGDSSANLNGSRAILVPAFKDKSFYEEDEKTKVMTYGESQGLTFDMVNLIVNKKTLKNSSDRILVALTRSVLPPKLIFAEGVQPSDLLGCPGDHHKILHRYVNGDSIPVTKLLGLDLTVVSNCRMYGAQDGFAESRLTGDPCQKAELNLIQRPDDQHDPLENEFDRANDESKNGSIKTGLPKSGENLKMLEFTERMRDREARERSIAVGTTFSGSILTTEQFKAPSVSSYATIDCWNANNVFPKHSHKDDATFWMGVRKRLSFKSYGENRRNFKKARSIGRTLFTRFRRFMKGRPNFDQYMEECEFEFLEKKLGKNISTLSNNAGRSDPDKSMFDIFLFMKSQLCTKADNMFMDAKAAQTLACFHHSVVNKFGVICRATEKALMDVLPDGWYVHSKKNFDKMERFVKDRFPAAKTMCFENDYTAFDRSQDEKILAFEVEFLKWVGWPADLIEDYKELKFHLGCKLGNLAIMRFTGEFSTFFFNTLANMAFCCMQFNAPDSYTMFFAGDDMCIFGNPKIHVEGVRVLKQLSLKAKSLVSERPSFCGWFLTEFGLFKNPELVFFRLCAALERGDLHDVLDSYTIELGYAHRKSDLLYDIMSEEEMHYQWSSLNIVMKYKDYMCEEALLAIWSKPGRHHYLRRGSKECRLMTEKRALETAGIDFESSWFY